MNNEHNHVLIDDDPHFSVDIDTRSIMYMSADKLILVRGDHNSEKYTFEIPKNVDGHDLSKCTKIELHYINISSENTDTRISGFDDVLSSVICDENTLSFEWTIPNAATQYVGSLSFAIRFFCKEEDNTVYAWHTIPFTGVVVSATINSYEDYVEQYYGIIEQWHAQLIADSVNGESSMINLANDILNTIGQAGGICVDDEYPEGEHIAAWIKPTNDEEDIMILDSSDIVQIPGTSDTKIMSQKIVSDLFNKAGLTNVKSEKLTFTDIATTAFDVSKNDIFSNMVAEVRPSTKEYEFISITVNNDDKKESKPYKADIPFPNVYGGTYDFVDGTLTSKYAKYTFPKTASTDWSEVSCKTGTNKKRYSLNWSKDRFSYNITPTKILKNETMHGVCSKSDLTVMSADDTYNTDKGPGIAYVYDYASGRYILYVLPPDGYTKDNISSYMDSVELIYEREEYEIYNIDRLRNIQIDIGKNRFSSSSIEALTFDKISVSEFTYASSTITRNVSSPCIKQIKDIAVDSKAVIKLTKNDEPFANGTVITAGKNLIDRNPNLPTGVDSTTVSPSTGLHKYNNLYFKYENGVYDFSNLKSLTNNVAIAIMDYRANIHRYGSGDYVLSLGADLPDGVSCTISRYDTSETGVQERSRSVINSGSSSAKFILDYDALALFHIIISFKKDALAAGNIDSITLKPQLEFGSKATEFESPIIKTYIADDEGTINIDSVNGSEMNIMTTDYANIDLTYQADRSATVLNINDCVGSLDKQVSGQFDYSGYNIPVIEFWGNTSPMTKDESVDLSYKYTNGNDVNEGTCTLKWQGSSSVRYPKKNYTVKFTNAITVNENWGSQKKYCLKADWIDASHSRNVVAAKLWGDVVRTRANTIHEGVDLKTLPNCGAVDGFPCFVVINDIWRGIYNFNIPKDEWMFNMDSSKYKHAILCAETGTDFKSLATLDKDENSFSVESDNKDSEKFPDTSVKTSLDTLINACLNVKDASGMDNTLANYIDIDSAIDYYIFAVLLRGIDICTKNYILATYDGTKWFYSAYDLDCTFGLHWDGSIFLAADYEGNEPDNPGSISFKYYSKVHKLMELLYMHKEEAIKKRYAELRNGVLSPSRIFLKFANHVANIPRSAFDAEVNLWKTIPSNNGNDTNYVMNWYQERVKVVDAEIASPWNTQNN